MGPTFLVKLIVSHTSAIPLNDIWVVTFWPWYVARCALNLEFNVGLFRL